MRFFGYGNAKIAFLSIIIKLLGDAEVYLRMVTKYHQRGIDQGKG
jgi:hypothetical protein